MLKLAVKSIIINMLFCFLSSAYAELPFTFAPNTPAFADEVNANFNFLDKQASAISNRVIVLEGPNTNCPSNNNQLTVSYVQKIGVIGQEFMIGVNPYVLKKLPFLEMATGTKYIITIPWYKFGNLPFTTKWSEDFSLFCSTGNISGYPLRSNALVFTRLMRVFSPDAVKDMKSTLSANLEILVGQTIINIKLNGTVWETLLDTPIYTPNDYTDPVRFTEMAAPTRMLGEIDDLIDYIVIEKLQ